MHRPIFKTIANLNLICTVVNLTYCREKMWGSIANLCPKQKIKRVVVSKTSWKGYYRLVKLNAIVLTYIIFNS